MNRKGTILIEAIVSTVIIAISLTLIMESLLSAYRALNLQKDYTLALITMDNGLSRLLFDSSSSNVFDQTQERFKSEHATSNLNEGLSKENLTVQWMSGNKNRQISASTYIYIPPHDKTQS